MIREMEGKANKFERLLQDACSMIDNLRKVCNQERGGMVFLYHVLQQFEVTKVKGRKMRYC